MAVDVAAAPWPEHRAWSSVSAVHGVHGGLCRQKSIIRHLICVVVSLFRLAAPARARLGRHNVPQYYVHIDFFRPQLDDLRPPAEDGVHQCGTLAVAANVAKARYAVTDRTLIAGILQDLAKVR